MKISGMNHVNSVSAPVTGTGKQDALSRSLQKQIEAAKKQLQELAADKNMSDEEKMQKRQELQKKLAELNQQLKQHQMEQKREVREQARKEKEASVEDMIGGKKTAGGKGKNQGTGISAGSMRSMLSADASIKQADVQGRAATQMKGREGVLEMEIKLDSARAGGSTKGVDAKKEQLAETRKQRMGVESAQMQTLAEADKAVEKAAKEQADTDKTDADQAEKKAKAVKKSGIERQRSGEDIQKAGAEKLRDVQKPENGQSGKKGIEDEKDERNVERRYIHMDIQL